MFKFTHFIKFANHYIDSCVRYIGKNDGSSLEKSFLQLVSFAIVTVYYAIQTKIGALLFMFSLFYGCLPLLYNNLEIYWTQYLFCGYAVFVVSLAVPLFVLFRRPGMRTYFHAKLGKEWVTERLGNL